ncbi:peptidoglycan D,D-transpeptidase FtsI family protein [uncultured Robinsoniella sp.]|uniref:peptidoglycan D,D-transpeptidase FtsI family protein n=1 Tax=uncultured Robinsoniella sp. TaxID=904190 RepID=UPI00374F6591
MKRKKSTDNIQINEIPVNEPQRKQNTGPESRGGRNKDMMKVAYLFAAMFFMLIGYLVYFNTIKADTINSNVNNTKQDAQAQKIVRGAIISSDGETLAGTNVDAEGNEERLYPYENMFAHVVGYASNGKAGVESTSNFDLLTSHASILEQVQNEANHEKVRGDSVVLTLDTRLQSAAYNAMGVYKGAVVVMEPSTGKILAMVSKPDFNPNTISSDWDTLVSDETNSSLLNRAVQGLYPPGSTFKIMTALEYMREHPDYQNYSYNCTGSISKEDVTITCFGGEAHGQINLAESFKYSCNSSFANIGLELDNNAFRSLCEDFMFNNTLPISMEASSSRFELNEHTSYGEEMATAIGQGNTLVTPLHMALITSTVANSGTLMKPYVIDRLETFDGDMVKENKPEVYKELMSAQEAGILSDFMTQVVEGGTAKSLSGLGYTVAGKTGSAEYEIGSNAADKGTHSWFVGFSNVSSPDIVVSVIAEDGGTGSSAAVPIAQAVFDAYYNNGMNITNN